MNKALSRKRRGIKTKAIIFESNRPRLVVFRSAMHIYSQIVSPTHKGDRVLVAASTKDKAFKSDAASNKCDKARLVGQLLAERAQKINLVQVAFDRSGYKYHGRVKALAEGARESGLIF